MKGIIGTLTALALLLWGVSGAMGQVRVGLEGLIVDGHTGEPIEGATVVLTFGAVPPQGDIQESQRGDGEVFKTTTNRNGEYAFDQVLKTKKPLCCVSCNLSVTADHYLKANLPLKGIDLVRTKNSGQVKIQNIGLLHKNRNKILRGKFLDAVTKEPIEGASLTVLIKEGKDEKQKTVGVLKATSGADGSFLIEVPPKHHTHNLILVGDEEEKSYDGYKEGYCYVRRDWNYATAAGTIEQNLTNFAIEEYVYYLVVDRDDFLTIRGITRDVDDNILQNRMVKISGIRIVDFMKYPCRPVDKMEWEIEFTKQISTDANGLFILKTNPKYLYGLPYMLQVDFEGEKGLYRAILKPGENRVLKEVFTDEGHSLELEFVAYEK